MKIKLLPLILLIIVLSFSGCVKKTPLNADLLKLNEDATFGPVKWGMTQDEVITALGPNIESTVTQSRIRIENCNFFDESVAVEYRFRSFAGNTEEGAIPLETINIYFSEGFDTTSLIDEITLVLGDIETKGFITNGDTYDLMEENRYWHSSQSLEDTLDEESKQEAYKKIIENNSEIIDANEAYAKWVLSHKYLYRAQFVVDIGETQPYFVLSGDGYLYVQKVSDSIM